MDWSDVGRIAAKAAPVVGTLLGGPAGGAIGGLVASVFGVEAEPDKVAQAIQADPEAAIKLQQLQNDHAQKMQAMVLEAETSRLAEVNKSFRAEVASSDWYVRRMRPTYGYILAAMLAAQTGVAVYVVGWEPASLPDLSTLFQALSIPQSVALAVLGVYVNGRSKEKMAGLQGSGQGLLSKLFAS